MLDYILSAMQTRENIQGIYHSFNKQATIGPKPFHIVMKTSPPVYSVGDIPKKKAIW